jgi:hypothetical protein
MQVIQHQELSGTQASIQFLSIPQTFTDLCLVYSLRTDRSATDDSVLIRFNSVTTNFTVRELRGTGSAANSNTFSVGFCGFVNGASSTSNTFSSQSIYIPNYANGNNKSFSIDGVFENNATSALQGILAGLWSQTNAITSITLVPDVGPNFVQFSSATLYGITKGSDGIVTVS